MDPLLKMFHTLSGELNKIHKEACKEVSVQQSTIMHEIQSLSEPSMQETARGVGMDITTFSRQIQSLVTSGHVSRKPYPGDRRIQILSLTELGESAVSQIDEEIMIQLGRSLSDMGDFEKEIIIRSLQQLYKNMSKEA
ncbi:MarR family winged helix-turn-helix transcriptional regulator [Edaphobacillus lindanitolerans]|uniref:DNA-binding transcriptional regulator, MarR family n=1 Tax=Edaphobacillus lindanitolerans TaxID=550447 RepID=A0A1U7PPM5_9BACI|nr:MarR family winged helix-turn-helix transcriptional regulator [Edaphobacillus lindanitolerans]SIT80928.1 DNA-binding transcriptional regulator, MarR family [Edaphobacillus lindanitolerans]